MADHLVGTEINDQRIAVVENCFGASGQPLAKPGRVLVGEGILTKECRKKPKPRVFFLFNDILLYGTIVINKIRYTRQHIIPLEDVTIDILKDTLHMKNRWLLKASKKSFVLSAASFTERREWVDHIKECVQQLLEKTGRQPSANHAAPWIPDIVTDICMRCMQTKFTTLNRKHHCRKCGFVVCHECSKYKFLIPGLDQKPVRVCGLCHRKLTSEKIREEEEAKQCALQFHSEMPKYDPSSEEDSDTEENEKNRQWPSNEDFYSSSWSAFHS
ncbi:pleckstrin homology domain-containing family F member 1 [Bombina bombina]|uniref:pleckstrin homology domain-containing family F member 1 n=1 Tax=Bombina bombina TaxID=8345 RepID=UPI00235A8DEE|nr:pleckstrin homology domain-containing family F member 1 [Bombina bombina]XP_053557824.1 pleckstrin homology domain-containing family F member 1 [Bombina bombina]